MKVLQFFCKASSNPEPCYQWFHDNIKIDGETSNILHVCKLSFFFLHQNNINVMNFFFVILDKTIYFKK